MATPRVVFQKLRIVIQECCHLTRYRSPFRHARYTGEKWAKVRLCRAAINAWKTRENLNTDPALGTLKVRLCTPPRRLFYLPGLNLRQAITARRHWNRKLARCPLSDQLLRPHTATYGTLL
jgi:hypothetical protein